MVCVLSHCSWPRMHHFSYMRIKFPVEIMKAQKYIHKISIPELTEITKSNIVNVFVAQG